MPQVSQEHLDFIPRIYETITQPENWNSVLQEFAFLCGAADSQLIFADTLLEEVSFRHRSFKHAPEVLAKMDEAIMANGSGAQAFEVVSQYPVQTWVTEEIAHKKPIDQLPHVKLMKELIGQERSVALCLNATPIWFDGLILHFKTERGNITEDETAISQIFLPHMAKAVEMSRPFLLLKQRFNAILSVIDRLQIGIVITNEVAEIITCNSEAENQLAGNNGLSQSRNKKLHSRSGKIQTILAEQIFAAANTKDPAAFQATILSPKRTGELPWLLDIFPLGNLGGEIDRRFKGAAILITDPDKKEMISTRGMEKIFDLTQAESNICELITRGFRAEDVAEERNATLHTVRSQIKSLLHKTATSSQLDLVRLALKVNLPVERKER